MCNLDRDTAVLQHEATVVAMAKTIQEPVVKWLEAKSDFCLHSTGISGIAISFEADTSRSDCIRHWSGDILYQLVCRK